MSRLANHQPHARRLGDDVGNFRQALDEAGEHES